MHFISGLDLPHSWSFIACGQELACNLFKVAHLLGVFRRLPILWNELLEEVKVFDCTLSSDTPFKLLTAVISDMRMRSHLSEEDRVFEKAEKGKTPGQLK